MFLACFWHLIAVIVRLGCSVLFGLTEVEMVKMGVLHFGVNYVVAGAKNRVSYGKRSDSFGFVRISFGFCSDFKFHVI